MLVSGQGHLFSRVHLIFRSHRTGVGQKYVIKFLDAKKFALNGIVAAGTSVHGEQTPAKKAVKYWAHQVKLGQTTMEDEVKPAHLPLDDIEGRIMAYLSREPYLTVCSIARVLSLAPATVHRHLTISLDMKPRHFRWVPTC
jgi:hypothetical protein